MLNWTVKVAVDTGMTSQIGNKHFIDAIIHLVKLSRQRSDSTERGPRQRNSKPSSKNMTFYRRQIHSHK